MRIVELICHIADSRHHAEDFEDMLVIRLPIANNEKAGMNQRAEGLMFAKKDKYLPQPFGYFKDQIFFGPGRLVERTDLGNHIIRVGTTFSITNENRLNKYIIDAVVEYEGL